MAGNELQKDFKREVAMLQHDIEMLADGVAAVVGTKEDPIVTNSELIPIKHYFMDGVYIREMTMKKGIAVVGAIHKHLHMCFLLTGRVTVVNEEDTVDHIAPCFIISTPGIKRVLYAHEDSIWFNTHKNPSNASDVKQLEKEIVAISYEEYEEYIKNK
jgi:hypothetical protein